MGAMSRALVSERFSWKSIAGRTIAVYEQMLAGSGPSRA
jgi:hypothetical protein